MERSSRGNLGSAEALHSLCIRLLRHVRRNDPEFDMTPARLSALSVLVFGGPRSPSALARIEQVSRPTMSLILKGMQRSGYVVLLPEPGDARSRIVHATYRGRRLMLRARARRGAVLAELLARTSARDRKAIVRTVALLDGLLAHEEANAGPPTWRRRLPGW